MVLSLAHILSTLCSIFSVFALDIHFQFNIIYEHRTFRAQNRDVGIQLIGIDLQSSSGMNFRGNWIFSVEFTYIYKRNRIIICIFFLGIRRKICVVRGLSRGCYYPYEAERKLIAV